MINNKVIFRHIVVWVIFISYEIICIKFTVGLHAPILNFVEYYILYILLFYVNSHLILDTAFFKTSQPYLVAAIFIFLEILLFTFLKAGVDYGLSYDKNGFDPKVFSSEGYILSNVFREIFFIGFSIAYWSMLYMIRFKDRNHQMETEQLKSHARTLELENKYISVENAYLQNQISPHLLFNSLSFIHNEVYKVSAEAGSSVARLSDLMRYSLVSADDTRTVLLSEETAQVENLIELCRMRFREQFFLRFKKKGKLSTVQIIPLVLVTLVENMMKHGDMGEKKSPAHILLELEANHLKFETRNLKRNTNLYPKGGLGLKNIEKRLSNYYQGRYQLLIDDEVELFTVKLTIDL
ncbi:sensor histidine kinase YesM [Mucilaginibacter rubeus]|uniref:sensor histidine kinase n=1 Tax=Mucilaginibacter rubeus TaxID=2027860 RepID=UPI00339B6BBC